MQTETIKLNKKDLASAFALHYAHKFPIKSRLMLFTGILLILIGLVLTIVNFEESSLQNVPYLKFLFLIIGGFYVAFYFYKRNGIVNRALQNESLTTPHQLFFLKDKFKLEGEKGFSEMKWKNCLEKVENEATILLYFTETQFYILPKRTLNNEILAFVKQKTK